jgi:aldose 1-epimerase
LQREPFGTAPNGSDVELCTMTNAHGVELRFLTFGGIIVSLKVPDRAGVIEDVTIGYDALADYLADPFYLGALIGRYANRIAKGRFALDGREHSLAVNDGANHLHGGVVGFNRVNWSVESIESDEGVAAVLRYSSADGEEGYPGNVELSVTYTVTPRDALIVDYSARADRATPLNPTSHMYFNLSGNGRGDILGHELVIDAGRFTPVDVGLIPNGELATVRGTAFDFTSARTIGSRIDSADEQLRRGGGYDHNFVLDDRIPNRPAFAAELYEPVSGRLLTLSTTEPGLQFYSGNGLGDAAAGEPRGKFIARNALALEPQHFPDSPNQPRFPSTIVRPGETFTSRTVYAFSTRNSR